MCCPDGMRKRVEKQMSGGFFRPIIYISTVMEATIISAMNSRAARSGIGATQILMKLNNRRFYYETREKASQNLALVFSGNDVRSVPRKRGYDPGDCEVTDMDGFENLVSMLDYVLDTKRKRHITGGILLSVSLLFGGLALTVMSIKDSEEVSYDEEGD